MSLLPTSQSYLLACRIKLDLALPTLPLRRQESRKRSCTRQ
jgi:hypothetical protein